MTSPFEKLCDATRGYLTPPRVPVDFGDDAMLACPSPRLWEMVTAFFAGDFGRVSARNEAANLDFIAADQGCITGAYAIDPTKPADGWCDNTLWLMTDSGQTCVRFVVPRTVARRNAGERP
jgi:hypothetical protein